MAANGDDVTTHVLEPFNRTGKSNVVAQAFVGVANEPLILATDFPIRFVSLAPAI